MTGKGLGICLIALFKTSLMVVLKTAPPAAWPRCRWSGGPPAPASPEGRRCAETSAATSPEGRRAKEAGPRDRPRARPRPRWVSRPGRSRQALLPWQRAGQQRGDVRRTVGGALPQSGVSRRAGGRMLSPSRPLSGSPSLNVFYSGRGGRLCFRGSWR